MNLNEIEVGDWNMEQFDTVLEELECRNRWKLFREKNLNFFVNFHFKLKFKISFLRGELFSQLPLSHFCGPVTHSMKSSRKREREREREV
jgi:hypothetical protein